MFLRLHPFPRQILHTLVFPEMDHHPWDLSHFIEAGTGINDEHRPVEYKCAEERQWNRFDLFKILQTDGGHPSETTNKFI